MKRIKVTEFLIFYIYPRQRLCRRAGLHLHGILVFLVILLMKITFTQEINIHTSRGTDTYDLSDIDSITFSSSPETGTVMDFDENVYKTIKIGNQWWMAKNLKVKHYNNGDKIRNVTNATDWINLSSGAYCSYNNDDNNIAIYGILYNWFAVGDSRNVAPEGWHVPSYEEWETLIEFLGGGAIAGGKMKETGTTHWISPNNGATNESGFTALPGGFLDYEGNFRSISIFGVWWSSTGYSATNAWYCYINNSGTDVQFREDYEKIVGFSIRCIKN